MKKLTISIIILIIATSFSLTTKAQSWEWNDELDGSESDESGSGSFEISGSDKLYFVSFSKQMWMDDDYDIGVNAYNDRNYTFYYNSKEHDFAYVYPENEDLGTAYSKKNACEKAINYYISHFYNSTTNNSTAHKNSSYLTDKLSEFIWGGGESPTYDDPYKNSVLSSGKQFNWTDYIYGSLYDKRDGRVYKTLAIDTLIWMTENLALKVKNGCWVYENDQQYLKDLGALYSWETAKNICPTGWRLPSAEDWNSLVDKFGGKSYASTKLKSKGGWKNRLNNANSSGFSAMPGGYIIGTNFTNAGEVGAWWTNTSVDNNQAINYSIFDKTANLSKNTESKDYGYSVRCVTANKEKETYGTLHDKRDGKSYKTIKIGGETWMAENLAYKTYSETEPSAHGRYYRYRIAVNACPAGWHLPSKSEYEDLVDNLEGKKENLLASSGAVGLSIYIDGSFKGKSSQYAYFWTNTYSRTARGYNVSYKNNYLFKVGHNAYGRIMIEYTDGATSGDYIDYFQIRCVKD